MPLRRGDGIGWLGRDFCVDGEAPAALVQGMTDRKIAGHASPPQGTSATERSGSGASVSRSAFREAVRILEHLDSARMREGRGGGLVVTEPRPEPLTQAAAIYLRYRRVDIHSLYSARVSIEVDLVERAVKGMDPNREATLRVVLAAEETAGDDDEYLHHTSDLHLAIADAANNEPLALFLRTLISLSDEYSRPKVIQSATAMTRRRQDSHRAHEAIVEAIVAGDGETAVRRMRSHLGAVEDWMPR